MSILVQTLAGVGEQVAQLLARLGIHDICDLLFHLPRGYEDRSRMTAIQYLKVGQSALLEGVVQSIEPSSGSRGGRTSLVVQLSDGTGRVSLRFFQLYPGLKEKMPVGRTLRIFGEIRMGGRGLEISHPDIQVVRVHRTCAGYGYTRALSN